MFSRILIGATLFLLGYFIGKEAGRVEEFRRRRDVEREDRPRPERLTGDRADGQNGAT